MTVDQIIASGAAEDETQALEIIEQLEQWQHRHEFLSGDEARATSERWLKYIVGRYEARKLETEHAADDIRDVAIALDEVRAMVDSATADAITVLDDVSRGP